MLPVDNADILPLLFHLNSEPWQNIKAYTDPSNEARFDLPNNAFPAVPLPPATESKLSPLFEKRRSCRSFDPRPLALSVVSGMLAAAYGITGINSITGEPGPLCSRPLPSAGGLYPLEIYLTLQNIEGADDGLYRYNPLHHFLELVRTGPVTQQLTPLMNGQPYMEGANVIFFITADFSRTLKKYGPRGYRYLLLEAGHCAQNTCLLAAENDLGALCAGGFLDRGLNRFLDLEDQEYTLYCVAVGNRAA